MELRNNTQLASAARQLNFAALVWKAIQTQSLRVPSMIRNFAMFSVSSVLVRYSPLHKKNVALGNNVRIQRLRSLIALGPFARISIADDTIVYENARLEALGEGVIRVGHSCVLGDIRINCRDSVVLGNRVLTSWNVFIQDNDPHPLEPELRAEQVLNICRNFYPKFRQLKTLKTSLSNEGEQTLNRSEMKRVAIQLRDWKPPTASVSIGDDVWLGAGSIILKGAHLGDGCVVASGSVVTAGMYPPRSVLAGQPARVVKSIPGLASIGLES